MRGIPEADLSAAKNAFIEYAILSGNVPQWVQQQRTELQRFIDYHGRSVRSMTKLEPHHLYAYLGHCRTERQSAPITIHRIATMLRSWARWCRKTGLVHQCRMADTPIRRPDVVPVEHRTIAEYLAALAEWDVEPYADFFRVLLGCGIRRGELIHLHWEDINLEQGTLYLRRRAAWSPKGRRERMVALTVEGLEALRRVCESRKKEKHKGPFLDEKGETTLHPSTLSHAWLRFTRAHNLPPRLHSTRHAFATDAIDAGANPTDVQQALGHRAITTTMIYVKPKADAALRVVSIMERQKQAAAS